MYSQNSKTIASYNSKEAAGLQKCAKLPSTSSILNLSGLKQIDDSIIIILFANGTYYNPL